MALPTFAPKNHRRERVFRSQRIRKLKLSPLRMMIVLIALVVVYALTVSHVVHESPSLATPAAAPISKGVVKDSVFLAEKAKDSPPVLVTSRKMQGWDRLGPSHGGNVYGEFDSFTSGKTCFWQPTRFYYMKKILSWIFFSSRGSFMGTWVCRDCGQGTPVAWESCPLLYPRGKCPAFEYQDWDGPRPRSTSTYDPLSSNPFPVRLITSYGVGKVRKVEYEQPQCHSLRKPCFDMGRCTISTPGADETATRERKLMHPLPVYAYPGQAGVDLKYILDSRGLSASDVRHVEDPQMACLLISHVDDLDTAKKSSSWNFGSNHFVYGVTKPINETVHYGMAALGSVVLTEAQIRPGYDIPLPLSAIWKVDDLGKRFTDGSQRFNDLHRTRKHLLTFKGSIQDTLQPYYQHRWLAAEYLYEEPDVVIDVQCKHKTLWGDTVTLAPYDNPSQDNFDELMVNSTFAFCPGGSHVTSFRFTEVLSAGSIPVLLPEIVTPFYPEVDWSGCVLRVSQARIINLPRILRAISPEEIRERQQRCQRLYKSFLGVQDLTWKEGRPKPTENAGYLAPALRIWQTRLKKQNYGDGLDRRLLLSSDSNS